MAFFNLHLTSLKFFLAIILNFVKFQVVFLDFFIFQVSFIVIVGFYLFLLHRKKVLVQEYFMYLGVGVFFISFEEFIYFFLELFFTIIQNLFLYSKRLY